ncbi:hypothetical protein [Pseudonocardia acaciae]|uniref:hypothetical protein n=1 Tax=Pseudonocardia acaciae TaxID=551276 RepID=UPI0004900D54|nr:hypothetical protein [Pseudonocardia acaciae]
MTTPVRIIRITSSAGPVAVPITGASRPTYLNDLADVDTTGAPDNAPTVLRRQPDGIWRLETLPVERRWGDQVRYAAGAPADAAPDGAVHVDVTNGRIYRNERTSLV